MSEEKKEKSKFEDLIKKIEELSVKDLAELVKELEERFGVSAMAPVAVAGTGATAEVSADDDKKAEYTIHLKDAGVQKIAVIKAIREVRPDLGLKEAKDLADGAPKDIKESVPAEEAEDAKKKFTEAGATVELK
ncbi:MAG: 50S ribosomal protein L7/L12 [Berkelbacteria bacterium GW2011_GWA2_35_9]|uniref:Large ribosomal subunit protein bL12 n=1 Tax=Berkelbacteria bacterium GW2011_GWA2_35_9 TaxID=1618333 RepID=A0A0G0FP38_9BACT|nr:MAG: 50S ribosomal protein L7/L12 [Berkelbacteria bacterium GW2011_GWA2_35_9]